MSRRRPAAKAASQLRNASDLDEVRARYADAIMVWARQAGIAKERVQHAFATVARDRFLTPPPWRIFSPGGGLDTETSDAADLYADVLIVLDRPKGINNGQPSLHAAWLSGVDPQPGESVVQIGIGAGYYTAILAELVGESGRIDGFEIDAILAEIARANLAGLPQVAVHATTGVGAALPPADVVYVSAGASAPDPSWLRALREGGRLVMPWQAARGYGTTLAIRRVSGQFSARLYGEVSFVGCIGADAETVRPRGIPKHPVAETRSVWFTAERSPDDTSTAIYADLWFSTEPVS